MWGMWINRFWFLVSCSFPFHIAESHYSSASSGWFAVRRFFSEQRTALHFPALQWDWKSYGNAWHKITSDSIVSFLAIQWDECTNPECFLGRGTSCCTHCVCQCNCIYSTCFSSFVVQSVLWYLGTAHAAMKYASWVIISIRGELAKSLLFKWLSSDIVNETVLRGLPFALSDSLQEPICPI